MPSLPDADRLHFGSKLAERAAVYTHREPEKLLAAWSGKTIHNADAIVVRSFDLGFIDALVETLERRNTMTVSLTEGQLYVDNNGASATAEVREHRIA